MKFILILLGIYLFYRVFLRPRAALKPPQEPDIYIEHEEVKKPDGKNK